MTQADSKTESDEPNPTAENSNAEAAPVSHPESTQEDAVSEDSAELLARLDEAQAQVAQEKDRYLRAVADLENFRRRVARDKEELRQFGLSDFVQNLLPALDNLNLGLQALDSQELPTEAANLLEGFRFVGQQIQKTFAEHGVETLEPEGEAFDPNLHDCVSHEPSETVDEDNVIRVMRTGYRLNGRLLRPASVVVSSGPSAAH
ncbi:MAG: nucleotide exchange factor GrpE [Opitutales bacterium]